MLLAFTPTTTTTTTTTRLYEFGFQRLPLYEFGFLRLPLYEFGFQRFPPSGGGTDWSTRDQQMGINSSNPASLGFPMGQFLAARLNPGPTTQYP